MQFFQGNFSGQAKRDGGECFWRILGDEEAVTDCKGEWKGKGKFIEKSIGEAKNFSLPRYQKSKVYGRIVIRTMESDKIARYQKKRSDGTKDFNFDKYLCKKTRKKERERARKRETEGEKRTDERTNRDNCKKV